MPGFFHLHLIILSRTVNPWSQSTATSIHAHLQASKHTALRRHSKFKPVRTYRSSFQSVTVAKPNANRRAAKGSTLVLGRTELDFQHLDWISRRKWLFCTVRSSTVEVLATDMVKSKGTNGLIRWVHGRPVHQELSSLSGSGNPWTTDYQKLGGRSRKSITVWLSFSCPLSLNTCIDVLPQTGTWFR